MFSVKKGFQKYKFVHEQNNKARVITFQRKDGKKKVC